MSEWVILISSGMLLGVAGSGHCVGMCGGIAGALGMTRRTSREAAGAPSPTLSAALYSLGRVMSYAALGGIAGALGGASIELVGGGPWLRVVAGLVIVWVGLQLSGLQLGGERLERLGLSVWRRLAPLLGWIGPADAAWKCLALGAVWGWLPCGLVYSALVASAATGSPLKSALFMACFGLGTVPALLFATRLLGGLGSLLRGPRARRIAGSMLVILGLWTAAVGLMMSHGGHREQSNADTHEHHAREIAQDMNPPG